MIPLKTKITLFITILLDVLVVGFFVFVLVSVLENNNETYYLSMELKDQMKKDAVSKMARTNLKDTEYNRKKINSYFVESDRERGVSHLIDNLELLGDELGISVEVTSIVLTDYKGNNPEISKSKPVLEELVLDMIAEGEWSDLVHFCVAVQSIPLKISIDKMTIEKNDDKNNWSLGLVLKVLKLK